MMVISYEFHDTLHFIKTETYHSRCYSDTTAFSIFWEIIKTFSLSYTIQSDVLK